MGNPEPNLRGGLDATTPKPKPFYAEGWFWILSLLAVALLFGIGLVLLALGLGAIVVAAPLIGAADRARAEFALGEERAYREQQGYHEELNRQVYERDAWLMAAEREKEA